MTPRANPFGAQDADRREIWTMLVERDIEAFVAGDWRRVEGDFLREGFVGIDGRGRDRPDAWRLAFPTLDRYKTSWLASSERLARLADPEAVRSGLFGATVLRDIQLDGEVALAHKKFDGDILLRGGGRERLRWQTLYTCRRIGGTWKIQGFVGYLPNPMGSGGGALQTRPPGARTSSR